ADARGARDLSSGLGEVEIGVGAAGDESGDGGFGQKEGGYRSAGTKTADRMRLGHGDPDSSLAAGDDVERGAIDRQHQLGHLPLRRDPADPAGRELGEIDIAVAA